MLPQQHQISFVVVRQLNVTHGCVIVTLSTLIIQCQALTYNITDTAHALSKLFSKFYHLLIGQCFPHFECLPLNYGGQVDFPPKDGEIGRAPMCPVYQTPKRQENLTYVWPPLALRQFTSVLTERLLDQVDIALTLAIGLGVFHRRPAHIDPPCF